ncbi:selenoprotein L isoform X1 [Leucoraja erinacea]|uniref:selenoprotein L isoform X1 n=1 Tax=Leucoraja erinaceus TaxID=7782 RepID=UPI0024545CDA|nr:selenoprotein L isoform X1 [Leucoraja erinacea]
MGDSPSLHPRDGDGDGDGDGQQRLSWADTRGSPHNNWGSELQPRAQEFVSLKIGRLAGLIQLHANFFNNLNVRRRSDVEDLFKKFYQSTAVRDQVEDLMKFELEWNNFLGDVDNQIEANAFQAQLKLGTQVPGCMKLTDVRSGREIQLEEFLHRREKLLLVLLRHFA